ncbi:pertussis toxin-like subunit ArtA [Escherichia coli]|nr:pertussis toxin-like subunit ArtA [Escherichia coli]EFM6804354.1 pertussis toxin-like subunit ArtA [Escherichia coli]
MNIIVGLLLILFSFDSSAVQFVYRVDSRPPDVVFRDGFRSHGNNRNLQQHIRGDSCAAGSRDSAFIATTSDINETYNIARQYFSSSLFRGQLYRYRIRANNVFYSLAPSVQQLRERGVEFTRFEEIMMREQSEIVADGQIPTENIAEAVQLTYDRTTGIVSDGQGTTNARFLDIHTDSNPGVIPNIPVPQVSVRERINAFGSLLTACFALHGSRDHSRESRSVGDYTDYMSFYDARPVIQALLTPGL